MTESINTPKTFRLALAGLALCSAQTLAAVTLENIEGTAISGTLGEINEDVVILYRPQAYSVPLQHISRIIPELVDDASERDIQDQRVQDLNRLIDHNAAAFKPFQKQARLLLDQKDYDALEKMARDAWREAKKTASGDWLLSAFYPAFREDLGKRDVMAHKRRWTQIKDWVEAHPQSSVALTALLRKTIDVAWAYRGSSYKVAKGDRTPHQDWMATAYQIADQLVDRTDLDSEMLYQLATVRTSIVPSHEGDALSGISMAVRAAELGPDYHHGFLGAVRMTMPRWGGSAAEMNLLMRSVLEHLPAEWKAETYFRMTSYLRSRYGSKEYAKYHFDWELIREGFEVVTRRFPNIDLHRHEFAAMAYLHGKHAEVQTQLAEVYPGWNHVAQSVWKRSDALAQAKRWSAAGAKGGDDSESRATLMQALRAVQKDNLFDLAAYLLKGGDPNVKDETGRSLLQLAARRGSSWSVYALLAADADLHYAGSDGWHAVHYAASNGSIEVLEMLKRAGADLDITTVKGDTPLNVAANNSNPAALRWLLEMAPDTLNQAGSKGYTPLLHVAYDGHIDMVQTLLAVDGIALNAQTKGGETALHKAARRGHEDIARLLLEAGADSQILNKRGASVLALAETAGDSSLTDYLRSEGLVLKSGVSNESIELSRTLQLRASTLYNNGEMAAAADLYKQAIDADPGSKSAHVGLAISQFMNEKPKAALRSVEEAIRIDPEDPELYYKAGRFAFVLGERETYMDYFTRYYKMAPDTHNAKDMLKRLPELAERLNG